MDMLISSETIRFECCDKESSIGVRFLQSARLHPNNIALKTGTITWTYAELANNARKFARLGQQYGCKEGMRIVIGLREPEDMVMAILGTLLIGCIYVPIEIDFPSERIKFVVDDSDPTMIIIDRKDNLYLQMLSVEQKSSVVFSDQILSMDCLPMKEVHTNPLSSASILYTSGSTGTPKGVLQTHRNILFHVDTLVNLFNITAEDRHSVLSSFVFDGSTTDLYCALLTGAMLIPINVRKQGAAGLEHRIKEEGVTIYHSTPTTYREMLNQPEHPQQFDSLRLIILGGETVTGQDFTLFKRRMNSTCLFVNGYGATETSGFVALNRMSLADCADYSGQIIPIGTEPAGITLFFMDSAGEVNELEGELYVRSQYIGMGYWNAPELTMQAYQIEGKNPAIRTYRTGDLAERCADGKIRLTGRRDRQVKVRGYRVDLSEIEATVVELPAVYQAVVKVYEDERTASQELALFVELFGEQRHQLRAKRF